MKKLRFFLYFLLFLIIISLFFLYISPSGRAVYRHNFSKKYYNLGGGRGFFYKLGPQERIFDKNKIIADPVYFYLRSSRRFSKAEMKIKYRLSPELSSENYLDIKAGILLNKDTWHYDLQPLFNSSLNQLINDNNWTLEEGLEREIEDQIIFKEGLKIFKRKNLEKKELDYNNFLFYNYSAPIDYYAVEKKLKSPLCVRHDIEYSIKNLQGSHSFYTYVCEQDLQFDFKFSLRDDFDFTKDNYLEVLLYQGNDLIFQEDLFFSKFELDSKLKENKEDLEREFFYQLFLRDLEEGTYKVVLNLNDQINIDEIKTPMNQISFLNRLRFNENSKESTVFSNKNNFRIKVFKNQGLGDFQINGEVFSLDKIYQQFNFFLDEEAEGFYQETENQQNLNQLSFNSGSLLIENDGLFSFSPNSFLNPFPNVLQGNSNLENFDFLIADYNFPEKEDDCYLSKLNFDLSRAWKDQDGYTFVLSIPFLNDLEKNKYLEILELQISLEGRPLKDKLKELFSKIRLGEGG